MEGFDKEEIRFLANNYGEYRKALKKLKVDKETESLLGEMRRLVHKYRDGSEVIKFLLNIIDDTEGSK